MRVIYKSLLCAAFALGLCFQSLSAFAEDLLVVTSGGFAQAYIDLSTPFLKNNPDLKIDMQRGPSMGETANAIPKRLERGEKIDVVIMVGSSLDELMAQKGFKARKTQKYFEDIARGVDEFRAVEKGKLGA